MNPKLLLSVAIPAISTSPLKGHSWPPKSAEQILLVVDGIDIMIYDTGASTDQAYQQIIEESLRLAEKIAGQMPPKFVRLGLPAYDEKTNLHRPNIEKSKALGGALTKFQGNLGNVVCSKKISFVFYAGWTMTEADKVYAATLREGFKDLCKITHQ